MTDAGEQAMRKAWVILAALTFARMTMGFQFQSVPAVGFALAGEGGMSFAALGALSGAYLLPGIAVALAGGWLAQRVGAARVAFVGLALMTFGGLAGWWITDYQAALFWRSIAGIGAVGPNVMGTKMAADWFEGTSNLPTAMGILVASWPAGIALATLILPFCVNAIGLSATLLIPAILCGFGWLLLACLWQAPQHHPPVTQSATRVRFSGLEWLLVCLAGSIWGIYNVALIGVIAWTPGMLEETGIEAVLAAASTSQIGWAAIFSVAAGGWLATRSRWRDLPALACFLLSAAIVLALPYMGQVAGSFWVMFGVGLVIGPAAATIMTLPIDATRVELRAVAMGIFFALYYAYMGIGPMLFGLLRDFTGFAGAPHLLASCLLLLCVLLWFLFRSLQKSPKDSQPA